MPELTEGVALSTAPETTVLESSGGKRSSPTSYKKVRKRSHSELKPLVSWSKSEMSSGADPLGHALVKLIDSGVSQALFLAVQPVPGASAPVFIATAAVNAGTKSAVWTGLRWDPSVLPEIWSKLLETGYVELPPPGTMTNLQSARNVSRAAFDITNDESLVLARVGTTEQWRGILVLVSNKSLIAPVKQVMSLLSALPQNAPKVA